MHVTLNRWITRKSCVRLAFYHIHASQVHMRSPSSSWNSSNEFKTISSKILTARSCTIIIV